LPSLCFLLGAPQTGLGQASCTSPDSVVVYVNGIATTRESAIWSATELRFKHGASDPLQAGHEEIINSGVWNPTGGIALDLLEAAVQSLELDVGTFMRMFSGQQSWSVQFRDVVLPTIVQATMGLVEHIEQRDLLSHVSFYKQFITWGHNVVVVSHS